MEYNVFFHILEFIGQDPETGGALLLDVFVQSVPTLEECNELIVSFMSSEAAVPENNLNATCNVVMVTPPGVGV